jgi:hypothetical protein
MAAIWRRRARRSAGPVGEAAPSSAAKRARDRAIFSDAQKNGLWLASFVALGTADIAAVAHKSSRLLDALQVVGMGGAAGLIITSASDLRRAETLPQKLDAGSDLAWGAQGLLYLSSSSSAAQALSIGLGVTGALAQTTVGVLRIHQGVKQRDRSLITLGALDLGGGLLWLGCDLLGWEQALFIGGYVVLMIAREAYANREAVARLGTRARRAAQGAYAECVAGLCDTIGEAWEDTDALLAAISRRGSGQP